MEPTALAYAAGVIDCAGSIQVARRLGPARKRDGVRPPYDVIRAALTAVDPTVPHLLRDRFGGSVYRFEGRTARKGAWHRWAVVGRRAGAFLRAIRPYLRLKGPQADAALRLDAVLAGQRAARRGRPTRPVSERELAQRLALLHEVRRFNTTPTPTPTAPRAARPGRRAPRPRARPTGSGGAGLPPSGHRRHIRRRGAFGGAEGPAARRRRAGPAGGGPPPAAGAPARPPGRPRAGVRDHGRRRVGAGGDQWKRSPGP